MPLVIHELVVTAEVEQRISTERARDGAEASPLDTEEIVRECVEEVLKQLERRAEK